MENQKQPSVHGGLLLTVDDAAAVMLVSRSTVYSLIRHGRLASLKIGKARRIPRSSIEALIAEAIEVAS